MDASSNCQNRKPRNGSKWIKPDKRIAIYARDGFACAYCGQTIEDGISLSLDHLVPYCEGGENGERNLVTACVRCNQARGTRDWHEFANDTARYMGRGLTGRDVIGYIEGQVVKPLDRAEAKAIMARRNQKIAALNA